MTEVTDPADFLQRPKRPKTYCEDLLRELYREFLNPADFLQGSAQRPPFASKVLDRRQISEKISMSPRGRSALLKTLGSRPQPGAAPDNHDGHSRPSFFCSITSYDAPRNLSVWNSEPL